MLVGRALASSLYGVKPLDARELSAGRCGSGSGCAGGKRGAGGPGGERGSAEGAEDGMKANQAELWNLLKATACTV